MFNIHDEENRNITNVAAILITGAMAVAFVAVWLLYYNNIAFRTYIFLGALAFIAVWIVLYLKFAQLYGAFKIASLPIAEIAFAQFLSVAVADLLVYGAACLIARQAINILPGIVTVVEQLVIGITWAILSKQYFLKHVKPRDCLLLYDETTTREDSQFFIRQMESRYGHLFHFLEAQQVGDNLQYAYNLIQEYQVIFLYELSLENRSEIMQYCVNCNKRAHITPSVEDVVARGYEVKHYIDKPLFSYNGSFKSKQTYTGKRLFDLAFSVAMLIVASPFMLLTALAIKIEDGGDIFFKQARCTQGGKIFNIIKFRSMIMDAEKDGKPKPCMPGDSRVTKVGAFIRKTRLDELPQLFNIIVGDLSLVGPRPERIEHVDLYTREIPEFSYRLRVKAGLTGYAQIYGKYNTSAHNKLLLDLLYIEQQSFFMDLKMIFLTLKIIVQSESTEGFDKTTASAIHKAS